jgi:hypothetical protein
MNNIQFVNDQQDNAYFDWQYETAGGIGYTKNKMLEQLNRMEPKYRDKMKIKVNGYAISDKYFD